MNIFRYLGVHINKDLSWTPHFSCNVKGETVPSPTAEEEIAHLVSYSKNILYCHSTEHPHWKYHHLVRELQCWGPQSAAEAAEVCWMNHMTPSYTKQGRNNKDHQGSRTVQTVLVAATTWPGLKGQGGASSPKPSELWPHNHQLCLAPYIYVCTHKHIVFSYATYNFIALLYQLRMWHIVLHFSSVSVLKAWFNSLQIGWWPDVKF